MSSKKQIWNSSITSMVTFLLYAKVVPFMLLIVLRPARCDLNLHWACSNVVWCSFFNIAYRIHQEVIVMLPWMTSLLHWWNKHYLSILLQPEIFQLAFNCHIWLHLLNAKVIFCDNMTRSSAFSTVLFWIFTLPLIFYRMEGTFPMIFPSLFELPNTF